MALRKSDGFAIWITGLPASGKSTLAKSVASLLEARGLDVAVLESDALRRVFVRRSRYDEQERDAFYEQMVYIGDLLTRHAITVIFDATANRRSYRERARQRIPRFLEIHVATPLDICMARDPKGIYHKARTGETSTVPGLQVPYEAPECPDVIVNAAIETPDSAAERVLRKAMERGFLEELK